MKKINKNNIKDNEIKMLKEALANVVDYIYNKSCCQASEYSEITGFAVLYTNHKPVFYAVPTATCYVNACSSCWEDEEDEELLNSQLNEMLRIIKESEKPVLLHSSAKGKILFI